MEVSIRDVLARAWKVANLQFRAEIEVQPPRVTVTPQTCDVTRLGQLLDAMFQVVLDTARANLKFSAGSLELQSEAKPLFDRRLSSVSDARIASYSAS